MSTLTTEAVQTLANLQLSAQHVLSPESHSHLLNSSRLSCPVVHKMKCIQNLGNYFLIVQYIGGVFFFFLVQLDNEFLIGSSSSDNDGVLFTGKTFPQITIANHDQNVKFNCLNARVSNQIEQKPERKQSHWVKYTYTHLFA